MKPEPDIPSTPETYGSVAGVGVLLDQPGGGLRRLTEACWPELREAAASRGLLCGEVDLGASTRAAEALVAFGRALNFPDWYGANFDALADCLDDYGDAPASGGVVLLRGTATLQACDPAAAVTLLAVLNEVSTDRRDSKAPLWVFDAEAPANGEPKPQP